MFWEILKASKGLPVTDQYAALWGKKIAEADGWKVTEITGELPLAFLSDGSVLVDYKIYGTSAGAGVKTENLVENIINSANISANGTVSKSTDFSVGYGKIEQGEIYTAVTDVDFRVFALAFYDSEPSIGSQSYNADRIIVSAAKTYSFTAPITGYVAFRAGADFAQHILVKGSTPPDHYIPHGYKLPLTVESGETENKFDKNKATLGKYINSSNVEVESTAPASSSKLNHSDFIKITAGQDYTIKCSNSAKNTCSFCWYSQNKELLERSMFDVSAAQSTYTQTFAAPSGAEYLIVNYCTTYQSTVMLTEGSTPPDHYIPHRYTSDIPIYIGSSKLGEEEYVDFGEQKVYKRTENLFDPTNLVNGKGIDQNGNIADSPKRICTPNRISVSGSSMTVSYVLSGSAPSWLNIRFIATVYDGVTLVARTANNINGTVIDITGGDNILITWYAPATDYVLTIDDIKDIMLTLGSTPPETFIPYLQPTDPPVPLPPIPSYKGENTLSSTETLGEVTMKGRIKPETLYRQVEYLKSTGTQYIQTDIIPFNTTKIKLDMYFGDFHEYANASTYNSYFCGVAEFGGDTTSDAFWGVSLNELSGSTDFDFYLGNVSWQESANHISNPANITTRQTMQICRGSSYWGNQTALVNAAVTKAEPTEPLAIMGFNCVDKPDFSPNPYKCRNLIIYGVMIYLNGSELSHNLIPVERKDGKLGLLDTITNKFYANAGTGTFEKGDYI